MNIGDVVGNRYTIQSHIGRGGMQDVYLANDLILGTNVALKTPQPGQAQKRFKRSAIIAARVNHHNIAKTLDYLEIDSNQFLIEEFVPGETLEDKAKRFKFVDPHLGARILHHLSKGVAASHLVGVVHRDLKPSNIIAAVGANLHELKITDFGIATLTQEVFDEAARDGDLTRSTSGTIRGALPYMAPEMMFRAPGEHPGTPSDIWSIGAMMFRLLTGEYPFGVYLEAAVNVKNQNRKPWPSFMMQNPQFAPLSLELQGIVESCLDYDPAGRPTAKDLIAKCSSLCYLSVDRREGNVSRLIQNGYSGFADSDGGSVFFSMESVYGPNYPNATARRGISFSSFPGSPCPRAHPVVIVN